MSNHPALLVDNLPARQRDAILHLDQLETLAQKTLQKKLGVIERDELVDAAADVRDSIEIGRRSVLCEKWKEVAFVARNVRIQLARVDSGIFTEHVMRTEKGNQPIRLTPMHREWHDLADLHRFLVLWAHIESGKTSMFLTGRLLWRIGRNPSTRAIVVSESKEKAVKILSQGIAKYILQSDELHEVFPDLVRNPDPTTPWNQTKVTVKREGFIRDPTVQVVGAMRGSIQGARADFLALDDVVTRRTSGRSDGRRELAGWVNEDLLGRVDPLRGEVLVTNTARCKGDLTNEMATIASKVGGHSGRYGVLDANGKPRCPWWSTQKIDNHFLSATEKQRQLFVRDMEDEDAPFQMDWAKLAIKAGDGYSMVYFLTDEERDTYLQHGFIACGVDLAAKKKRPGAKTVFTVLYVTEDGTHQILWMDSGNWTSPEIRDRLLMVHERYRCPIYVETNGVQSYLKEIVEEKARDKGFNLRIESFVTGANKHDPVFGVESLFVQMSQGRWMIPSAHGNAIGACHELIQDMESYRPNAHSGDALMATWICKEGIRNAMQKRKRRVGFSVGSV